MNSAIKILIVLLFMLQGTTIYGEERHYSVGLRHISTLIKPENVELHIMLWYPTSENAQATQVGPYKMDVAKDAIIEPGNRALIMISHGDGGSHLNHRDTAAYLSKRGYIVAAVLHPHNNFLDNSEEGTLRNLTKRPHHISKAVDIILTQPELTESVDTNRIAIIGHSAGAYTALALSGGVPNSANIRKHCIKHNDDPVFCNIFVGSSMFNRNFEIQNGSEGKTIKTTSDPRIKAAILMAPVGVLFNGVRSLSDVIIPLLIYRAEKDDILHYPYHATFLQKNLSVESEYIVVKNAGHHAFITPIPDHMKKKAGKVAIDPDGFDRMLFHTTMNQEIAFFLSKSLSP